MFRRTMAALMMGVAGIVGHQAEESRRKPKHSPKVSDDFRRALQEHGASRDAQAERDLAEALDRSFRQAHDRQISDDIRRRAGEHRRGIARSLFRFKPSSGPCGRALVRIQRRTLRMGTAKLRRRHHLGEYRPGVPRERRFPNLNPLGYCMNVPYY